MQRNLLIDVRKSTARLKKYSKKIRALVLPGQKARKKFTVQREVDLERMVECLVGPSLMRGYYMVFAKQINKLMGRWKGLNLITEVCIKYEMWKSRGLIGDFMNAILAWFNLPSCEAPPCVPEEYIVIRNPTANTPTGAGWTNPTSAYTSDNFYATAFIRGTKQQYHDYDFDSVLPDGLEITKVEVGLEFYCMSIESLRIRVSVDGGVVWSGWSNFFTLVIEDIIWINVTTYRTPWIKDYLLDGNWTIQVEYTFSAGGGCFLPGTMIRMWDGSQKPIKDIRTGDLILSFQDNLLVPGLVTKTTIHKPKIPCVNYKGVRMAKTHEVFYKGEWRSLPEDLEVVEVENTINIEVSTKNLFANNILVHNLEKEAWTAYLDWIPTRVTYLWC